VQGRDHRWSDLARLTAGWHATVANTWARGSALNITLSAGDLFVATRANAAQARCVGGTVAATGQIQSTPSALPGSRSGYLGTCAFSWSRRRARHRHRARSRRGVDRRRPAYWLDSAVCVVAIGRRNRVDMDLEAGVTTTRSFRMLTTTGAAAGTPAAPCARR
jgi:hypothetical protein